MTTYTSPSGKSTATNDCSGGHSIEVSHPSKPVDRNSELREVLEDCLVMKERIAELEQFIRRNRYNIKQNEGDGTQRHIDKVLGDL